MPLGYFILVLLVARLLLASRAEKKGGIDAGIDCRGGRGFRMREYVFDCNICYDWDQIMKFGYVFYENIGFHFKKSTPKSVSYETRKTVICLKSLDQIFSKRARKLFFHILACKSRRIQLSSGVWHLLWRRHRYNSRSPGQKVRRAMWVA